MSLRVQTAPEWHAMRVLAELRPKAEAMTRRRRTPKRPGLDDPRYWAAREELKRIGTHVCHTCKFPIDMQIKWPHPLSWSFDHRIPRSQLHPDDPRNWHVSNGLEAHLRCNTSRGAKPIPLPTASTTLETSIEW